MSERCCIFAGNHQQIYPHQHAMSMKVENIVLTVKSHDCIISLSSQNRHETRFSSSEMLRYMSWGHYFKDDENNYIRIVTHLYACFFLDHGNHVIMNCRYEHTSGVLLISRGAESWWDCSDSDSDSGLLLDSDSGSDSGSDTMMMMMMIMWFLDVPIHQTFDRL